MSLNLSNLKPAVGSAKSRRRVGRGGKRGSYSGRGMKGQKARSGGRKGLKALGFKQTLQRVPKKRGFRSLRVKLPVVNLAALDQKFADGELVDVKKMIGAGLAAKGTKSVKVLAQGQIQKKLTVVAAAFSAPAKKAIEAAGGQTQLG